MFNDSVSFNGDTHFEVIAVLANCGRDTDRARRALVTWIRRKQDKGRSTEHILNKLRDMESKFIRDTSLHSAFRDARAETFLPRAPDLPLPPSIHRRSEGQTSRSALSPSSTGARTSASLSPDYPLDVTQQTSPPVSPLRLSRGSSQMSDVSSGKPNPGRLRSASHVSPSWTPRVQIPCNRSSQPASSSSKCSPEDSASYPKRLHTMHLVNPVSPSSSKLSPQLATPPGSPPPPFSRDRDAHGSSRGLAPPVHLSPLEIPRRQSRRSIPHSPHSASSERSDLHSQYPSRGSMSPGRRRVTPPMAGPPDVPLPPIPSDEQGFDLDIGTVTQNLPAEQPPTPVRYTALPLSTPARPLPIQPVPSPVPSSNSSTQTDIITGNTLRQQWHEPSTRVPVPDDVIRQDSPVYEFHVDPTSPTAPPPYVEQFEISDPHTVGEMLERAVNACGGSPEVLREVSRCIGFHRGYEPPYWQTRLQASGLNAEAAKYLVDEMSKHVDWSASFGRAI